MAEFRILAGSSMLKLATKPRYMKFVTAADLITLSALCCVSSRYSCENTAFRGMFLGSLLQFRN